MKKYFLALLVAASMIACGNKSTNQDNATASQTTKATVSNAMTLDKLLANADEYVNKKVDVVGHVTHTCKHSGKRCFLTDDSQDITIRVEAKGKIGGFNRELIGSQIDVTGTFKERRMTTAEIATLEKTIEEKRIKDDGSAESCDAETANIQKMRDWMKEHNKDYYAIYYIDGEDYKEVE